MYLNYKAFTSFFVILYVSILISKAQSDTSWHYSIEGQALGTPAGELPFWLRVDQSGSIPLAGTSAALIGNIYKNYNTTKHPFLDWGAGVEARANVGITTNLIIIQAYLKVKKDIFQLKAGRDRDFTGLVDTSLSSGSFSVSGNALGIPKVEFSIPDYYILPFFGKILSAKLNYAFGFLGNMQLSKHSLITNANTYFQQNSLYLRLGKPAWKLKFFGGINHNVMYGHDREIFGSNFTLSRLQSFIYAGTGKTYAQSGFDYNGVHSKVGNHIGSIDIGTQYEFENVRLFLYRQNLYDVGALAHLANIADGINGISLTNKHPERGANPVIWEKFLLEFIYTKNQAGSYAASAHTLSGDEDYYNNYVYSNGWSYKGLNLGNPLLAAREYTRSDLIEDPDDYIINNRIIALNAATMFQITSYSILVKLTYSKNYGTYGTAPEGHSTGNVYYPPKYGIFSSVTQFSGYIEGGKDWPNGYRASLVLAGDYGRLYYNSVGLMLKLKKSFN